jgi:DNA-binding transcriptional ArsR family regulator
MRQPREPDADQISLEGVLAALGDPVRLHILSVLSDGAEHLRPDFDIPLAESTISHHRKVLREAGITRNRQEGTRCYVSLRPELAERFPGLIETILSVASAGSTATRRSVHR